MPTLAEAVFVLIISIFNTYPFGYATKLWCVLFIYFNPSNAEAYFIPSTKYKYVKIFENHLNTVMLAFIGQLLLSTVR